ncbi:NAD(P)H-hydrate dehydratase [Microbacterium yannicii]|uniref:ADP-dependent (S)-NAD(P)H-hydrate dehydratase n=1 Tax=Microbacterium yannicii TaxID=671622 RepID=A0ABP9MAJ4_9MICO|nr:ADP/ATP-dependent (S)-NAD(P)H-hydrate dehydratase [Microbacterium yannicii]MCO5952528.1 NAD(P)H-hydrate dehydratase [Microbacterium yannicii]
MSNPSELVSGAVLREWGLPEPGDSKKSRGEIVIVGGARSSPGAVILAGEAALRVGAGRVALAVPASIDAHVGIAIPEAGIYALPDDADAPLEGRLGEHLASADAVLIGPGFDDPDETRATVLAVADTAPACLVLDAFAVGVLPDLDRSALPGTIVLSANKEEAAILLGRPLADGDELTDLLEIARRFDAVVSCYGITAHPDGRSWRIPEGGPGLGTSGSGDVRAGAIAGFAARGVEPERAAIWGAWTHAAAGMRLTERIGLGFLARELAAELTPTVKDVLSA